MKIGHRNHNPNPNHAPLPNLLAISKYVTIIIIANNGGHNNDNVRRHDLQAILNHNTML